MWHLSELTHQLFHNFLFCRTNFYFKMIHSAVLITQNHGAKFNTSLKSVTVLKVEKM